MSETLPALPRPGPALSASAPVRRFRWPPAEWIFGLAFAAFGSWVYLRTPIRWAAAETILYRHLALAFVAGSLVMMALAYGVTLLRGVPAAERNRWTRNSAILAAAITLACILLVPAPQARPLNRLLESAVLGTALTSLALTLFLPVAGLVRPRQVAGALAEGVTLWGPYLLYFVFCGACLAATRQATPLVMDPLLLRMDLSLGFNASQTAYAWHHEVPWIRDASLTAYRLLGLMIALVIARLQIARAGAHARRALLAALLVGVLGLGCYHLVPAIGPIHAFPALHRVLDSPARQTEAAVTLESVLTGPDEFPSPRRLFRDAMPSLHTAFTLVALAAAWNWRRRFFWACLPLGFLQIVTTLTLAYHYLVDLFAAVPLAVLCWWIADAAIRATPRAAEEPLPAPAPGSPTPLVHAIWLGLSLVVSVTAFLLWAKLAPLPPWAAWTLALLGITAPTWAAGGRLKAGIATA